MTWIEIQEALIGTLRENPQDGCYIHNTPFGQAVLWAWILFPGEEDERRRLDLEQKILFLKVW